MNDEPVNLGLFRSRKNLSDKDKIVYGYHLLESGDVAEAKRVLGSVTQTYFMVNLYRDISRALLCWITYKSTNSLQHYKEAEFYLVIYKLTKKVVSENLMFKNSTQFDELLNVLFKDFSI